MPPVRRLLAALATTCFIGAVALTPSEVRSRFQPLAATPAPMAPRPAPLPAAVVPDGDPFVARAADDAVDHPVAVAPPPSLAAIGPLPPNAGAAAGAFAWRLPAGPVVRAIATGPHPAALLDVDGSTHLVTAGDRIGGTAVRSVDPDGVTLDDGRRLALPAAGAMLR